MACWASSGALPSSSGRCLAACWSGLQSAMASISPSCPEAFRHSHEEGNAVGLVRLWHLSVFELGLVAWTCNLNPTRGLHFTASNFTAMRYVGNSNTQEFSVRRKDKNNQEVWHRHGSAPTRFGTSRGSRVRAFFFFAIRSGWRRQLVRILSSAHTAVGSLGGLRWPVG